MPRQKGVPFWIAQPTTEVGWMIRNWRLHNNLTVLDAAARLDISPIHLNALETGRSPGHIRFPVQKKIAVGIGIPLRKLVSALPWQGKRTKLGELVVYSRAELFLSRSDLVEKTGLPKGLLASIELGRRKRISFCDAIELAVGLNIQLSALEPFVGTRRANEKASLSCRGRIVREGRKRVHMSQVQLAKALRTSRQMISAIELGHVNLSRSPLFDDLVSFLKLDLNLLCS